MLYVYITPKNYTSLFEPILIKDDDHVDLTQNSKKDQLSEESL